MQTQTSSLYQSKVLGTGAYLPKKILTNSDLEEMVDTTDQWIYERTGIKARRICSYEGGEWPTDMAMHATFQALETARLKPNDIDMILFATLTPDQKAPSSAALLQEKLGMTNYCMALDIVAACSGFVYGFNMAHSFIQSGMAKTILVVGSEILSREINWKDRNTCILFGDGCGCALIGRAQKDEPSAVYSTHLGADGTGKDFFSQRAGGSVEPLTIEHLKRQDYYMQMKGAEMFKMATRTLTENAQTVLKKAGMTLEEVQWLVPHQANLRIIETTAKLLKIPKEKIIINIQNYGNTSAATVPIALHEGITEGKN